MTGRHFSAKSAIAALPYGKVFLLLGFHYDFGYVAAIENFLSGLPDGFGREALYGILIAGHGLYSIFLPV